MKITRIEDVYTVPKTEADWAMLPADRESWCRNEGVVFGNIPYNKQRREGKKEIPVDRFLDLLNDKIAPWRLLEVGFFRYESDHMAFDEIGLSVYDIGAEVHYVRNIDPLNINTFSELLQMMKFCGWKNEEQ